MKNATKYCTSYLATILLVFLGNLLYCKVDSVLRTSYKGIEMLFGIQAIAYIVVTSMVLLRTTGCVLAPAKTVAVVSSLFCILTFGLLLLEYLVFFPTAVLACPLLLIVGTGDLFNAIAASILLKRKERENSLPYHTE